MAAQQPSRGGGGDRWSTHSVRGPAWLAWFAALWLCACQRPLHSGPPQPTLQEAVQSAIAQELQALPPAGQAPVTAAASQPQTTQPQTDVLATLAARRTELETIGPLGHGSRPSLDLGPDLTGQRQQQVEVGLQAAVESAISHNLGLQAARLQPAINAEEVIAAQAVFDAVLVGNVDLSRIDEPQSVPVLNGIRLGTPFRANDSYRFETGVRKRFTPGTEVSITTDLTRFRNRAPGITFFPDPAYTAAVRFGVTQPLLRGFGSQVNTSVIRLSENQQRRSQHQLQGDLLQVAASTEIAYWDLVTAWRELAIAQWLVDVGVQVRDVLARRQEFDTRPAQYSDAVARVEQRQADVIRAQRLVRAAADALKLFINDPQTPEASEAVLFPADAWRLEQSNEASGGNGARDGEHNGSPVAGDFSFGNPADGPANASSPPAFDLREVIFTAVDQRPEIHQAALDIDDASIRQVVADNQRLPLLDLSAQVAYVGLQDDVSGAYSDANSGDFIDYIVGLAFQMPLGNRAAEAQYRQARLRRSAAMINYQRAIQNVVLEVKAALRDVITNHQLIRATFSFRVAQAENLRTLLVEEQMLAGLTPEFLNLKFQRQETLAQARRQEVQALSNYNKSLARLYRAMGIGLKMKRIDVESAGAAP